MAVFTNAMLLTCRFKHGKGFHDLYWPEAILQSYLCISSAYLQRPIHRLPGIVVDHLRNYLAGVK